MAINQVKTIKVVEAASDGSGCGTILASFKGPEGETLATEEAERLARTGEMTNDQSRRSPFQRHRWRARRKWFVIGH